MLTILQLVKTFQQQVTITPSSQPDMPSGRVDVIFPIRTGVDAQRLEELITTVLLGIGPVTAARATSFVPGTGLQFEVLGEALIPSKLLATVKAMTQNKRVVRDFRQLLENVMNLLDSRHFQKTEVTKTSR